MISSFDQWLTSASTHRLLRLLVNGSRASTQSRACQRQRRFQHDQRAKRSLPVSPEYDEGSRTRPYDEQSTQRQRHSIDTGRHSSDLRQADVQQRTNVQTPTVLPFGIADPMTESIIARVHDLRSTDVVSNQYRTIQDKALEARLLFLKEKVRDGDLDGIGQDWKFALKSRCNLPVHGRIPEEIWQIYSSAAVQILLERREDWLLLELLEYARVVMQEKTERYVHLFRDTIGSLLLDYRQPDVQIGNLARRYYNRMLSSKLTRPADLVALLEDILRSEAPRTGVQRFKLLYSQQRIDELDKQCARLMRQHGHNTDSEIWQSFFEQPSSFDHAFTPKLTAGTTSLPSTGDGTPPRLLDAPVTSLPTRQTMNTIMGEAYGIEQKSFSDEFCAKVLATKFFSLEACIKGLQVLGVDRFGSIAILELTRRAQEPVPILECLEMVRKCGIRMQDSIFFRMVKHFAKGGHGVLLSQLLTSDQHPDEYQNVVLQRKLLLSHVDRKEWLSMEIALVSLSLSGQSMDSTYWNVLLRHHINEADFLACQRIFEDMQSRHIRLKVHTVRSIFDTLLPTRNPGKAPDPRTLVRGWKAQDALDFAMVACTYAAECGEIVPSSMIAELLKRCGLTHQLDALEKLLFWLGDFYSAEKIAQRPDLPAYKKLPSGQSLMEAVLQDQMIGAIVLWEWRTGVMRQSPMPSHVPQLSSTQSAHHTPPRSMRLVRQHSWSRGISLLKHLKDRGHPVSISPVRNAIAGQLWKIFGPGQSSRKINDLLIERNQMTLQEYIEQADRAWPGIFSTDKFAKLDQQTDQRQMLLALFGKQRRTGQGYDMVDIAEWSEKFTTDSATRTIVFRDRPFVSQRGNKAQGSQASGNDSAVLVDQDNTTRPRHQSHAALPLNLRPQPNR